MKKWRFNLLYLVFFGVLFGLVPMTRKLLTHPTEFYGIAENQVRNLNFQYSAEIVELPVVLGQKVDSGQLLARLYRMDLPMKVNEINYEQKELSAENALVVQRLNDELVTLGAKKTEIISAFETERKELETEASVRSKILAAVQKEESRDAASADVFQQKLHTLEANKNIQLQQTELEIKQIQKTLQQIGNPVSNRLKKLDNDLDFLKIQEQSLELRSPVSGIIGQLDFQLGEKVAAYTSIMKIYGERPNVVTTYIADGHLVEMKMGDTLRIASINRPDYVLKGVVVGLGTRITMLPERLRKVPELKAWGREVQLKIPDQNELLQGERVKIMMPQAPGKYFSILGYGW